MMPGPSSSPTVAAASMNSDDVVSTATSRWASSLPDDLVRLIASLLLAGDLQDYVRFRAVCASWRSGTASPRGRGVVDPRFHPRRWMMLPEGRGLHPGHPKLRGYVRFFNLDTGAFVRVHIPLFQDHCALDSMDGLLVLQRDHDTAVRLLHPFTGDIVDLPPLSMLLPQLRLYGFRLRPMKRNMQFIRNISAAATFVDGVVTVMLAFVRIRRFAVATPQDQQWTMPPWSCPGRPLLSSQGKIFVECGTFGLPSVAQFFQIDTPLPGEQLQPPKLIATCNGVDARLFHAISLVECGSEILAIFYAPYLSVYALDLPKMLIYRLTDIVAGRYIPVTSIGDDKAIFIKQRSIVVSASTTTKGLPMVKGDTVIYNHHFENKGYLSQYDLSNDTRLPAMDHCSLLGVEPGPCSLIHHILSCCSPSHWNKGLLLGRKKWPYANLRWPMTDLRHGA